MTATHCTCSQSWTERHAPGCVLFDPDPLYVAEPEHVTERADRIAERILVAVLFLVAVAYVALDALANL